METDEIIEIRIDELGRLCVKPKLKRFFHIYRTATEVHWDEKRLFLFSPKPREWSYFDWFKHIFDVIKNETNCILYLTEQTCWIDIPDGLKYQIQQFYTK